MYVDSKLGVPLEGLVNKKKKGLLMTYDLVWMRLLFIEDYLISMDPNTLKVADELAIKPKGLRLVKIRIRESISYLVSKGIDHESISSDGKITTKPDSSSHGAKQE